MGNADRSVAWENRKLRPLSVVVVHTECDKEAVGVESDEDDMKSPKTKPVVEFENSRAKVKCEGYKY